MYAYRQTDRHAYVHTYIRTWINDSFWPESQSSIRFYELLNECHLHATSDVMAIVICQPSLLSRSNLPSLRPDIWYHLVIRNRPTARRFWKFYANDINALIKWALSVISFLGFPPSRHFRFLWLILFFSWRRDLRITTLFTRNACVNYVA